MATTEGYTDAGTAQQQGQDGPRPQPDRGWWKKIFRPSSSPDDGSSAEHMDYRSRATLGILSDPETDEVPGTVLLLSSNRNEPLGLRHQPHRTSASSLPIPYSSSRSSSRASAPPTRKKTSNGQIVLEPQPDDSRNDPLNWPVWRRDAALVSLGFYCLMGGGMTPVLAAGFNQVAEDYNVDTQKVAYTTGLYMLGLGIGSVIMSPTAILWGKRPVYILGASLFIISAVWCALSPNYASLVLARIFQGIAVSPVECLPSATIAEIYFLHERAYRVGIYTLLLLGGKNLVPLVSAAIIGSLSWRWVFWIVAIIVGACLVTIFFFLPETFWDRTPRPRRHRRRPDLYRSVSDMMTHGLHRGRGRPTENRQPDMPHAEEDLDPASRKRAKKGHVGFLDNDGELEIQDHEKEHPSSGPEPAPSTQPPEEHADPDVEPPGGNEKSATPPLDAAPARRSSDLETGRFASQSPARSGSLDPAAGLSLPVQYTDRLRERTDIPYIHYLRIWNGRMSHDRWIRVAVRPFILFTYPAVLWSAVVYALSVGWLASDWPGLYISVRGRFTGHSSGRQDFRYHCPLYDTAQWRSLRARVSLSDGDPDCTLDNNRSDGLWLERSRKGRLDCPDFCVDSYRQYAGEALVTLNWSKSTSPISHLVSYSIFRMANSGTDVFHGLIFSLFVVDWMEVEGARMVFVALGVIQFGLLLFSIPMYIYGKRARMWTVRKRLMEKY